ncbi:hypothetical protein QR680_002718 [Steinernema hermaphroditum]|uniref:Uncharacterized protein n=1 Tax=Steinernema hermaphroditum TaxID=289476 RepID=A0AA39LIT5_9BILA|nr:hypothetical protein QR680_002718 [Steinernema hermaphroditum]
MDSVPYVFCDNVLASLDLLRSDYAEIAKHLSEPWGSVAAKYSRNVEHFSVWIVEAEGFWWCSLLGGTSEAVRSYPNSLADLLSMDRRFIRIEDISLSEQRAGERNFPCSEEELTRKLLPFLALRMRQSSMVNLSADSTEKTVIACMDALHLCYNIDFLWFPFCGSKSIDFLAEQLKSNFNLKILKLSPNWKANEDVEHLLVTFINEREEVHVIIMQQYDLQSPLKVTIKMIKAARDSWKRSHYRKSLYLGGRIGFTHEELISMSLAPNLSFSEHIDEDVPSLKSFRWTTTEGLFMNVELNTASDAMDIKTSYRQ